jgi:hypothetical protein
MTVGSCILPALDSQYFLFLGWTIDSLSTGKRLSSIIFLKSYLEKRQQEADATLSITLLTVALVCVLVLAIAVTARNVSLFYAYRHKQRNNSADNFCPGEVRRIHQAAYAEMVEEVLELKDLQAEVRTQLGILKKVVSKIKKDQRPSVISKDD